MWRRWPVVPRLFVAAAATVAHRRHADESPGRVCGAADGGGRQTVGQAILGHGSAARHVTINTSSWPCSVTLVLASRSSSKPRVRPHCYMDCYTRTFGPA